MAGGRLYAKIASTYLALVIAWAPSACVPDFTFGSDAAEACSNGSLDEGEADYDCGGVCSPCPLGKRCSDTSDCADGSCIEGVCRRPSCADNSLSPGETDLDCGGSYCAPCGALEACELGRDCESGSCDEGRCRANVSLGGGSGDGDLSLGGGGLAASSGGGEAATGGQEGAGGSTSGGAASGGEGSGGGASGGSTSGGASSGGASTGGASSGGASSGGASSGGASSGGSPPTLCEQGGFAFCDDFEDGNSSGWSLSGGTWTLVDESNNYVYSGGNGSQESTAGSASWTDVAVQARVKIVQFGGTSSSYRAGIAARFSGPSDFFTLAFDASGNLRLLKSTSAPSGASGTCGSLSYPATVGTWYDLRLEVSGPAGNIQIRSYVNGVLQHDCHTTVTSVAAGKAGVLTVGTNTIARFDDVTVALL